MTLNDVRFKWTSGAACPDGIHLENVYHLIKKNDKLYFSDGNFEQTIKKEGLFNCFTPSNCKSWDEVEFEETEVIKFHKKK